MRMVEQEERIDVRVEPERRDLGWWSVAERMGQGSCSRRTAAHVKLEEGFGRYCVVEREVTRSERLRRAEVVV